MFGSTFPYSVQGGSNVNSESVDETPIANCDYYVQMKATDLFFPECCRFTMLYKVVP